MDETSRWVLWEHFQKHVDLWQATSATVSTLTAEDAVIEVRKMPDWSTELRDFDYEVWIKTEAGIRRATDSELGYEFHRYFEGLFSQSQD